MGTSIMDLVRRAGNGDAIGGLEQVVLGVYHCTCLGEEVESVYIASIDMTPVVLAW